MDASVTFSTIAVTKRRRTRLTRALEWLAVIAVIGALAFAGWSFFLKPPTMTGARVTRGPVADVVYATGFVEPDRPVDVSSRLTAPVTAVLADEGDRVVRGQPLVVLDAEDQREAIAQLTASRINAEQDERRVQALFKQGWVTIEARDKAVATANSARALEAAGRARLNQFTIRSGISGVVLRRDVEPGDLATSAKTLFEIGDPKQLRVTATVDERDIPLVRQGASALMSSQAFAGRVIRGSVYEITPGGDPEQRAFRVRIRPDAGEKLPVGLTVEVNILVSQRQHAMLVPATAVRLGSVWVVEDGRTKQVPVRTGVSSAQRIEVTSGLSDEACVLSDPPQDLKARERVTVRGC